MWVSNLPPIGDPPIGGRMHTYAHVVSAADRRPSYRRHNAHTCNHVLIHFFRRGCSITISSHLSITEDTRTRDKRDTSRKRAPSPSPVATRPTSRQRTESANADPQPSHVEDPTQTGVEPPNTQAASTIAEPSHTQRQDSGPSNNDDMFAGTSFITYKYLIFSLIFPSQRHLTLH